MRRNIILFSLTILFIITTSILNSLVFGNKPEEIEDLEDIQKSANERYITAQILSQKLDNVYRLFEVNLATMKNDSRNEEANVDFINSDMIFLLKIWNKNDYSFKLKISVKLGICVNIGLYIFTGIFSIFR